MLDSSHESWRGPRWPAKRLTSLGVILGLGQLSLITVRAVPGQTPKSLMFGPVKYYCRPFCPPGTGPLPGSRPEDEIAGE